MFSFLLFGLSLFSLLLSGDEGIAQDEFYFLITLCLVSLFSGLMFL